MRHIHFCLALALALSGSLHADTIVMKTGQKVDGKVLSSNGDTVEIEVEYGVMRVPANLILAVEQDTPEAVTAREEQKAQDKEHAAMMRAEGKVLYKGKWIDEAEKEEIETKLAAEKKKKDEEKAAAKKKKDEELAKKKEELRKQAEEEQKRREQIAAQNAAAIATKTATPSTTPTRITTPTTIPIAPAVPPPRTTTAATAPADGSPHLSEARRNRSRSRRADRWRLQSF
jgi:hypothetical protein